MSELFELRKTISNNNFINRSFGLDSELASVKAESNDEQVETALLAVFGAGLTLSKNPVLDLAGLVILTYSLYRQYEAVIKAVHAKAMKEDKEYREMIDRYEKGESLIHGDRFGGRDNEGNEPAYHDALGRENA